MAGSLHRCAVRVDLSELLFSVLPKDFQGFHHVWLRDREPKLGASAIGIGSGGAEDSVVDPRVVQEALLLLDCLYAALGDDLRGGHRCFVCHREGGLMTALGGLDAVSLHERCLGQKEDER